MAEIILAEQTISGFVESDPGYSVRTAQQFTLTGNVTYRVVWDGVEYICLCYALRGGESFYLGNTALHRNGGIHDNSGEPFLIEYVPEEYAAGVGADAAFNEFFSSTADESHTVYIYRDAEKDANIVVPKRLFTFAMNDMVNELTWTGGAEFGFVVGDTYTVEWEGTKHVCQAKTVSMLGETGVGVGNTAIYGDENDTGEPFLFFTVTALTGGWAFTNDETKDTFTASIYKGVLEEDSGEEEVGKVIFEETEITFSKNTTDDIYCSSQAQERQKIALEKGKTYTVVWDGVEYVCAAEAGEIFGFVAVFAGNKSIDPEKFPDGTDTKEPFLIGYASEIPTDLVETLQTGETHTVAVYAGDITSGGGGTEDGYLLKDAELAFELETNSETVYYNTLMGQGAVAISVGKTYTVIWDGRYYDCTAKEYTPTDGGNTWTFVTLGNLSIQNNAEENTREPFVYLYVSPEGNSAASFKTLEKDASHVISIYDGVLEHPAVTYADIYTYDKDGNAVLHEKRSSVTFDTPDGRYAVFKLSHIADSRS